MTRIAIPFLTLLAEVVVPWHFLNGTLQGKLQFHIEHLFAIVLQRTVRMEALTRAKSSRRGYRAHITNTYGRIQEIIEATAESTEPITTTQTVSLSTALYQLLQKQAQLKRA